MANYYVDLENGLDANNGTSFALRKKTISSTTTAMANGDTCRVMGSPDPVNTGINATFTDRSRTITLASAVTQTIHDCETNWTGATNVTPTTTTTNKHGTNAVQLAMAAGFAGGKIGYKATAFTDYSAYQQVSFWIRSSSVLAASVLQLKLCSDATGDTAVHTLNLPLLAVANTWQIVVVDVGSALNASIGSVALYRASGSGALTVIVDHIFASKAPASADAITLQSLISKNDGTDIWWSISGIDGTTLTLDTSVATSPVAVPLNSQFFGTTETVALWRRETIKGGYTTGTWQGFGSAGAYNNRKYISGGWNRTDMSTLTGETWIDNLSANGVALGNSNVAGYSVSGMCFARWAQACNIGVNGWLDFNIPGVIGCTVGVQSSGTGRHNNEVYIIGYVNCNANAINLSGSCGGATLRVSKVWNNTGYGISCSFGAKIFGAVDFRGNVAAMWTGGYTFQGPLSFLANTTDVLGFQPYDQANLVLQNTGKIGIWGLNSWHTVTVFNDPTTQDLHHIEDYGCYHRQETGVALECLGQNAYTTTADSAALSITGDIDIRVKLSPGTLGLANTCTLLNKFNTTGNQRSYYLKIDDNARVIFAWSANGSANTTFTTTYVIYAPSTALDAAFPHSGTMWVRATLDVDNGAGQYVATVYTSVDGSTWTLLQTTTGAGTTSIFDSTSPVLLGIYDGSSPSQWPGYARIYRAQIYNGIGGTLVYDANFEAQTHGTTSFSDGLGNTIALANTTCGKIGYPGISATDKPWRSHIYTGSLRTREVPTQLKIATVAAKSGVPVTVSAWAKRCFGDVIQTNLNRAYVVDAAPISITGDIDISVDLAAEKWTDASNYKVLVAKDNNSGSNREWGLFVQAASGFPLFYWWDSGANFRSATADAALPFVDGVRNKLRVTLDVDNGAGGHAVTFYTWSAGAWVQLGSVRNAGAFTTSIRDQAAAVSFTWNAVGTNTYGMECKYYRATVKNGIDGTIVLDANFEAQTPEVYSFADGYGNTVLLEGAFRIATSGGETFMDCHPLAAQICIPANQYGGPTTDTIAAATAANNVYEQLSVTFTPTADAMVDVYFKTFSASNRSSAYVSNVTATGGLLLNSELGTLNTPINSGMPGAVLNKTATYASVF